jgi:tetratricopeptide (TPR) repeat protein
MIAACCLLLLALAALAGFMVGQQSKSSFTPSKQTESFEFVQATAGSEAILDEAFCELGAGHPKKALLAFQKIQETQPSLTGLNYLIGRAAFQAREFSIAEEALQRSLSCKEMDEEARLLLAVIHLSRSSTGAAQGSQFSDPLSDAESEFRRFSVSHPADSAVYYQWAEALRSRGSYRTAAELLHKGFLRSDLMSSQAFLSAKEILTRLQIEPAKEVPSLSGITSMSGELAIGAAMVALQHKQTTEALLFFERAREFYSPSVFRELISDSAFDPYRTDPKMRTFFSTDQFDQSPAAR